MFYVLSVNPRHSWVVAFVTAQVRLDATEARVAVGRILVLVVSGGDLQVVGNVLPRSTADDLTLHDRRVVSLGVVGELGS